MSINKHSEEFKVISLFSGVGGLDIGFGGDCVVHVNSLEEKNKKYIEKPHNIPDFVFLKPRNFEVIFQNDILKNVKCLYEQNFKRSNYNNKSIYDLINSNYIFPDADVIIGGFPCQDFSHCGKRSGFSSTKSHNLTDEITDTNSRGTLYKAFVHVVKQVKPKVFIAENVKGLLTMPENPIDIIVKEFSNLGYYVKYSLIKLEKFGVPQTRHRVIIIGVLKTAEIPYENWHLVNDLNNAECPVKFYLNHLQEPSETTDLSQQSYSKAKKLTKGQGQKIIDINGFAPTVRAEHHGNIEFRNEKRRLTIREVGLIQTFSPDFIFNNSVNLTSYKFIGNAVPPLLSFFLAVKTEELLTYFPKN